MSRFTMNLLPKGVPKPPVYFHTACCEYAQHTMHYPRGKQAFHQILLVVSGTGLLRCQGREYPLTRGCAFFTAEGFPSDYLDTGGLTTAFLTARGEALPGLFRHYGCDGFLFAPRVPVEEYLAAIEQIIREYYENKREGLLSALTYRFFVDFFEGQGETPLTPAEQTSLFIERNFTRKLTLEQLAAVSGVSVSKLCHDFKKRFGCTVFEYILNLRLTYAQSFLRSSREARTKAAALACGFEDISYFCRAYKKKFGKTPAQDRAV